MSMASSSRGWEKREKRACLPGVLQIIVRFPKMVHFAKMMNKLPFRTPGWHGRILHFGRLEI